MLHTATISFVHFIFRLQCGGRKNCADAGDRKHISSYRHFPQIRREKCDKASRAKMCITDQSKNVKKLLASARPPSPSTNRAQAQADHHSDQQCH